MKNPNGTESRGLTGFLTWRHPALLMVVLLVSVTSVLLFPFPVDGRIWGSVFDLAHAPAFFCILLVAAMISLPGINHSGRESASPPRHSVFRITALAGALGTLGAAAEFLQNFSGRSGSVTDALANTAGVIASGFWLIGQSSDGYPRQAARLFALSILAVTEITPMMAIRDSLSQVNDAPRLSSLEYRSEAESWRPIHSSISRSSDWATDGAFSLKVVMKPAEYSGAWLEWMSSDWTKARVLRIDVLNKSTQNLQLHVKVYDRQHPSSGFASNDRFDQEFSLASETQTTIQVPIEEILSAPTSRRMNSADIGCIGLFCVDVSSPEVFYIDNVRLDE